MAVARFGTLLLLLLVLFASLCSCLEGRKLVLGAEKQWKKKAKNNPSSKDSLFLSALPKGTVSSSSPSKKGHAVVTNEKLRERHLISMDRVLLLSVPSPGAGH